MILKKYIICCIFLRFAAVDISYERGESEAQSNFLMEIFPTGHGKGIANGIGDKSLILIKVLSQGGDRIIVQPSNDFSKSGEQLLNKPEEIQISQEEISSTISEVIDWGLITQSLGLVKNNIHVVTCNDGYEFGAF